MNAFLVKIAEYYKKIGDGMGAGCQVAWIADKSTWYIAVHRFPTHNVNSRLIVAKANHVDWDTCVALIEANWENIRAASENLGLTPKVS